MTVASVVRRRGGNIEIEVLHEIVPNLPLLRIFWLLFWHKFTIKAQLRRLHTPTFVLEVRGCENWRLKAVSSIIAHAQCGSSSAAIVGQLTPATDQLTATSTSY